MTKQEHLAEQARDLQAVRKNLSKILSESVSASTTGTYVQAVAAALKDVATAELEVLKVLSWDEEI